MIFCNYLRNSTNLNRRSTLCHQLRHLNQWSSSESSNRKEDGWVNHLSESKLTAWLIQKMVFRGGRLTLYTYTASHSRLHLVDLINWKCFGDEDQMSQSSKNRRWTLRRKEKIGVDSIGPVGWSLHPKTQTHSKTGNN